MIRGPVKEVQGYLCHESCDERDGDGANQVKASWK